MLLCRRIRQRDESLAVTDKGCVLMSNVQISLYLHTPNWPLLLDATAHWQPLNISVGLGPQLIVCYRAQPQILNNATQDKAKERRRNAK
jgi:hypothetical protein